MTNKISNTKVQPKPNPTLLLPIRHPRRLHITLVIRKLLLPHLRLLLLLNDGAAATAARQQQIRQAGALQVVLVADVRALHPRGDEGQADATGAGEEKAAGVDGLVAGHVAVLARAVVGLAEGHAGETAGD